VRSVRGGPVTVGQFVDAGGSRAAVIVNRSYRDRTTVTVESSADAGRLQRFDVERGRWVDDEKARWRIDAGRAVLVRWQ
jgi:hypothetical protein